MWNCSWLCSQLITFFPSILFAFIGHKKPNRNKKRKAVAHTKQNGYKGNRSWVSVNDGRMSKKKSMRNAIGSKWIKRNERSEEKTSKQLRLNICETTERNGTRKMKSMSSGYGRRGDIDAKGTWRWYFSLALFLSLARIYFIIALKWDTFRINSMDDVLSSIDQTTTSSNDLLHSERKYDMNKTTRKS